MKFLDLFQRKSNQEVDSYWEYDSTKHFRPKLNTSEFYSTMNYDLFYYVFEIISEYIENEENELKYSHTLSYGQKAIYFLKYVENDVLNGGFTQYYVNGYGKCTPTIIKALDYIGDSKMSEIINRSYSVYLKQINKFNVANKLINSGIVSNIHNETTGFDHLDTEFEDNYDDTILNIARYIRRNPNEFFVDENGSEFDLKYTGEYIIKYPNCKNKDILQLQNGIITGEYSNYYENGNIKFMTHYKEGMLTGDSFEYYENGNIKFKFHRNVEENRDEYFDYFENGNLNKMAYKLIGKDVLNGEYKEWYKNGNLKLDLEFKNNEKIKHNRWNEDGVRI